MITINLSNTALSYSACNLALKRVVIDGYVEPAQDSNIVYGVAVHKFLDSMYKNGGNPQIAKEAAIKAFDVPKIDKSKSPQLSDVNHMLNVSLTTWLNCVQKDKDFEILELNNAPATEVTFSIKYYEDQFITVNLCGTLDRIGKIKGGCYLIRDWKTTSSWDNKGYFKSYELSRQLRLYVLSTKLMAKMYPESILGQIGATNIGAQINAVFLKPDFKDVKWYNSEVFQYKDSELDDFESMLQDKIHDISKAVEMNYFPRQGIINGGCDRKYGKCKFWNCCAVGNEQVAQILLERDFNKRIFDPMNYGGTIEV